MMQLKLIKWISIDEALTYEKRKKKANDFFNCIKYYHLINKLFLCLASFEPVDVLLKKKTSDLKIWYNNTLIRFQLHVYLWLDLILFVVSCPLKKPPLNFALISFHRIKTGVSETSYVNMRWYCM